MPVTDQTLLFYKVVLITTLSLPTVLSFAVWPSLRNYPVITHLPFVMLAFIGAPLLLIDPFLYSGRVPVVTNDAILALSIALLIGAIAFVPGFMFGLRDQRITVPFVERFTAVVTQENWSPPPLAYITLLGIATLSILLYAYSYLGMGFIPALAEDPLVAKYMAGKYQEAYKAYAAYYRIAIVLYSVTFPFLLALFFISPFRIKMILLVWMIPIFILTLFTLKRGLVASPILETAFLYAIIFRNGRYLILAVLGYLGVFTLGSAINDIALYLVGIRPSINLLAIVRGVPDVVDLTWFWQAWTDSDYEMALGRTIYGGMVPGHYEWNPGALTKLVIGGSTDAPTGGFRLPAPVWGYVNFGWIGVPLWGLFQGLAVGMHLRCVKYAIMRGRTNLLALVLAIGFAEILIGTFRMLNSAKIDTFVLIIVTGVLLFTFFARISIFPKQTELPAAAR